MVESYMERRRWKKEFKCSEKVRANRRAYLEKNREKTNAQQREWRKLHREEVNASARRYRKEARDQCLEHYGKTCFCCGENLREFLGFDHINGSGAEHRRREKIPNLAMWLKQRGFPEGFRTACHNCNLAMGFFGYCPHKQRGLQWINH